MFGNTQIPIRRFPQFFPMITSLFLIQLIFFLMLFEYGDLNNPYSWVRFGAMDVRHVAAGEWWRGLSAIFIHTDLIEFLLVTFALYSIAPQLEWLLGKLYFVLVYVGSGIAYYLCISITQSMGIYHGASGCVFGLLGVYLYLAVRKALHPRLGKGLLILCIIYLFGFYETFEANLFALIIGTFLGFIFIQLRHYKTKGNQ